MSRLDAWKSLLPENDLIRSARTFVASIQAHALVELGDEEHVQDYEPRTLALISTQVGGPVGAGLAALAKQKASDDEHGLIEEALS